MDRKVYKNAPKTQKLVVSQDSNFGLPPSCYPTYGRSLIPTYNHTLFVQLPTCHTRPLTPPPILSPVGWICWRRRPPLCVPFHCWTCQGENVGFMESVKVDEIVSVTWIVNRIRSHPSSFNPPSPTVSPNTPTLPKPPTAPRYHGRHGAARRLRRRRGPGQAWGPYPQVPH